jgi:D-beta-D-heptose 7-phosphate kinase/D-beta-D-heptose 1-phosphate adenosyltransferase
MARDSYVEGLITSLRSLDLGHLEAWGRDLATLLSSGGRLLVAGNGGSAAQAQHLTAELVGRFSENRDPLPAMSLHADTSTVTAVANDFGFEEVYSRQVRAHGRPGDVLLVLSTSGRSPNLMHAVAAARMKGMRTWALTGPTPNPLARACDEFLAVETASAATVQECHLVGIHLLCGVLDGSLAGAASGPDRRSPGSGWMGRLVVVGDAVLDKDVAGDTDRVSPEAPVPVVSSARDHVTAGGAGRAAVLAAEAGYAVTLVTALAGDADAGTLSSLLAQAGVTVVNLGTQSATAVKVRVRSRGQTIVMVDRSPLAAVPGPVTGETLDAIDAAQAILVSDYGRGMAADDAVRGLLSAAARRVPVVWDPHPRGPSPVARVRLVTPNDREARGFAPAVSGDGLPGDGARARHLRSAWEVAGVVITRGGSGAILVCGDEPPLAFPAPTVSGGDSRGAGDMFAVAATASLGQGMLASEAVARAVTVASAYVASGDGHAPGRVPPAAGGKDAVSLAARVRASGGVVVATGGCFDLLHRGHVSQLADARRLGDCLIVCLNSDASASRLKGDGRPVVPAEDRVAVLSALACVDAVIVFDEDTPAEVLRRVRPHLWVKGGDYAIADMPECAVVEEAGGEVVLVPYIDGRSSTGLIERAAAAYESAGTPDG